MPNTQLTFGEAIGALKRGERVARKGWNGKGLFVFMQMPANIPVKTVVPAMQSLPQSVKDEFLRRLSPIEEKINKLYEAEPERERYVYREHEVPFLKIKYRNQFCIVYPDNTIYGWAASPSDIASTDWEILD